MIVLIQYEKRDNPVPSASQKDEEQDITNSSFASEVVDALRM